VDRELLLEIGCEELPATWLPELTNQLGEAVTAQLREHRLVPESPTDTFSTPRRLTARVARVPERQADLEELVHGPPESAAFKPDGTPTPAATGFAAKHGVEISMLERVTTAKGGYLAFRKRLRGRASVDVLPDVLTGTLRRLTFPKSMHWDAVLDDGHGELPFGRPIRWILYIYGGRVVPFTIGRTTAAQTSQVQDISSGAVTYGHRFLTTSGRAGRAIKVRSFEEYRARLLENFVILERGERHDKIARELDAKALRLKGRVSRSVRSDSGLLQEVPDLVEYPSAVAGTFAPEFLQLPPEVLTTTLVHHQHYFPVESEDGKLMPAFLAVINTEPDNERSIARNAERVVTARLRDARFFWETDRKVSLETRVERLATLLFHKKLGSYKEKSERIERLAEWIASESLAVDGVAASLAARAARLSKTDLTTDMVREFTELQGTMGGIYAREEGLPEEVWKAIYYQYLPLGIEPDSPPTREQLGKAAVTWTAVSLADKLDTTVGLFAAGERPTGSRDPYGLRRAAHGIIRVLVDLPELASMSLRLSLPELIARTGEAFAHYDDAVLRSLMEFFDERAAFVFEERGSRRQEVRAVRVSKPRAFGWSSPLDARRRLEALVAMRGSDDFRALAEVFKRVKNITRDVNDGSLDWDAIIEYQNTTPSVAPAEKDLIAAVSIRENAIQNHAGKGEYLEALVHIAELRATLDRYFDDVMVMVEDPTLRRMRQGMLAHLRDLVLAVADISEIAVTD